MLIEETTKHAIIDIIMKSWPIERQYSDLQLTSYQENDPNGSEMIYKAMNVNSVKEDFK